MFLDTISENQIILQYVKLFRMPLFLTMLDEEFKKFDNLDWDDEKKTEEIVRQVMPVTLIQFGIPEEETDQVIAQCLSAYTQSKSL
jgi:hypothetical protein